MTTELEKQFFDTFGIEPKLNDCNWQCQKPSRLIYMCANNNDCEHCKEYPQITDRQYLELICISNKELIKRFDVNGSDLEGIKSNILSKCIKDYTFYSNTLCETHNRLAKNFKPQVQAIFKGENGF